VPLGVGLHRKGEKKRHVQGSFGSRERKKKGDQKVHRKKSPVRTVKGSPGGVTNRIRAGPGEQSGPGRPSGEKKEQHKEVLRTKKGGQRTS